MASQFWNQLCLNWQDNIYNEQFSSETQSVTKITYIDTSQVGMATIPPIVFDNDSSYKDNNTDVTSNIDGPNPPLTIKGEEVANMNITLYVYFDTNVSCKLMDVDAISDTWQIYYIKSGEEQNGHTNSEQHDVYAMWKTSETSPDIIDCREHPQMRLTLQTDKVFVEYNTQDQSFTEKQWIHRDATGLVSILTNHYSSSEYIQFQTTYNAYVRERNSNYDVSKQVDPRITNVETVSQAGLWKEVKYAADIRIKFQLHSAAVRKGGLGYQFSSSRFKPVVTTYTYDRDGEEVNAHVTITLNNLIVTSQRGALPTDFGIDALEVLTEGTLLYVDYWDDSQIFQNMVYVRQLQVEKDSHNFTMLTPTPSLTLPMGMIIPYWPQLPTNVNVSFNLVNTGISLSTQYTDQVSLNSLRFIYKFTSFSGTGYISRMEIDGIAAAHMSYRMSGTDNADIDFTARFSMISLVPANDDYRTPINSSVTVRQDLERELDILRGEFNALANNIAISQMIELATMPFDLLSVVSGASEVVKNLSQFSATLFTKFKNTQNGVKLLKYTRFTDDIESIVESIDDITDTTSLVSTMSGLSTRTRFTNAATQTLDFDDFTAATLKHVANKSTAMTQTSTQNFAEIATQTLDMIPDRAYRVVDKATDIVYEVSKTSKVAYKLDDLTEVTFDTAKFSKILTESPVLSAIIDFKSIKMLNQAGGKLSRADVDHLISSNPEILKTMINQNNPIIKRRLEDLIRQCRI